MTLSDEEIETDHYATLGLPHDATEKEIREAYRKKAATHHPDKHPGDKGAIRRMQDINTAYEILSNPETRREYDAARRAGFSSGFGFGSDFGLGADLWNIINEAVKDMGPTHRNTSGPASSSSNRPPPFDPQSAADVVDYFKANPDVRIRGDVLITLNERCTSWSNEEVSLFAKLFLDRMKHEVRYSYVTMEIIERIAYIAEHQNDRYSEIDTENRITPEDLKGLRTFGALSKFRHCNGLIQEEHILDLIDNSCEDQTDITIHIAEIYQSCPELIKATGKAVLKKLDNFTSDPQGTRKMLADVMATKIQQGRASLLRDTLDNITNINLVTPFASVEGLVRPEHIINCARNFERNAFPCTDLEKIYSARPDLIEPTVHAVFMGLNNVTGFYDTRSNPRKLALHIRNLVEAGRATLPANALEGVRKSDVIGIITPCLKAAQQASTNENPSRPPRADRTMCYGAAALIRMANQI